MNINLKQLGLSEYVGSENGRKAFLKIVQLIDEHDQEQVFCISLENIELIDASFFKESLLALISLYVKKKFFYVTNIQNNDVLLNLKCIAAHNETLVVFSDPMNKIQWIGKELTDHSLSLLEFMYTQNEVSSASLAKHFGISVPNASMKLKKLFNQGYIIGSKQDSLTGGHEYIYKPII